MATQAEIIARVKAESGYRSTEGFDTLFEPWLAEALQGYSPGLIGETTFPLKAVLPLSLLMRISLTLARATRLSVESSKTSPTGYGSDRDSPYEKQMSLAKMLRAQYERTIADYNSDGASSITSSRVFIDDNDTGIVFDSTYLDKDRITISSRRVTATTAFIDIEYSDTAGLTDVFLYFSLSPNIYDPSRRLTEDKIPYHSASATPLITEPRPVQNMKVTGLTTGTTYYFVVIIALLSGTYRYSNELALTTP